MVIRFGEGQLQVEQVDWPILIYLRAREDVVVGMRIKLSLETHDIDEVALTSRQV